MTGTRIIGWAAALALWGAVGLAADDWQPIAPEDARGALEGRALVYDSGARQEFRATGRTLYDAGTPSWGYWEIRAGRYCSQWPPGRDWDCYDLSLAPNGGAVRFTDDWGNDSVGRYTD